MEAKMKLNYIIAPELKAIGIQNSVVAEIYDVAIEVGDAELNNLKETAFSEIVNRGEENLNNPVLQSYRDLVKKVGRSVKKFPPAAESLIESILHLKRFPQINTAVDAYNIVAARKYLALGVHDIDKIGSTIYFRLSKGQESFVSVGGTNVKYTQPGDFVYADDKQILAWLDSKDSDSVKLSLDTKKLVIVIQGTDYTTRDYNFSAAEEACKLVTRFCGGTYDIKAIE